MAFPTKPSAYLLGSNGPVHALAYSSSPGTYILAGSSDRSIRLYNPSPASSSRSHNGTDVLEGRLIQTYSAHGYEVLSIAVSSGNESFVSSGGDRAVFLWDVSTGVTTRRFGGNIHGHTGQINCVSFAGAGDSLIVSGSFDTTARIWDVKSNSVKPIQVLDNARDAITSIVVRGPEVITGSVDGRVRSYDIRMGTCTADVIGASVTSLDITKDGNALLVGTLDSKLRLMDRKNGTCLKAYDDPTWRNEELRVQSLLAKREKYVIVGDEMTAGLGGREGRVLAWDVLSGKLAATITIPWGPAGYESKKKVIGKDGKEKIRNNVMSCMAWRDGGWGDQFCVAGTSGVVTVFDT
ncbi:hypothetical protein VHEMI01393 [[Torrubiella] hemipterigena]|uniref:Uncharacterized protein n=1 Tax=[Torrubiella] hemipterigena TaxID=1531966 RepID=A0A0A1SLT5_9HYPO|nr:hypothetical protein VHEMI01393 [[Torrubiella] hemipterigena]